MESADDLVVHFVYATVSRDWCVDGLRESLLRADTFPDGLVGTSDPRGEGFRRFDTDFRSRDDSPSTRDSTQRTGERAMRTGDIVTRSQLDAHTAGA